MSSIGIQRMQSCFDDVPRKMCVGPLVTARSSSKSFTYVADQGGHCHATQLSYIVIVSRQCGRCLAISFTLHAERQCCDLAALQARSRFARYSCRVQLLYIEKDEYLQGM